MIELTNKHDVLALKLRGNDIATNSSNHYSVTFDTLKELEKLIIKTKELGFGILRFYEEIYAKEQYLVREEEYQMLAENSRNDMYRKTTWEELKNNVTTYNDSSPNESITHSMTIEFFFENTVFVYKYKNNYVCYTIHPLDALQGMVEKLTTSKTENEK